MLKGLVAHWNDFFALVLLLAIVVCWHTLSRSGLTPEQVGLIVGASIVWLGQLVSFYWRKAPPGTKGGP